MIKKIMFNIKISQFVNNFYYNSCGWQNSHVSTSKKKSMRGSLELRELSARKLFSRLLGSFVIYFELFEFKTTIGMQIYLTVLERTDTVERYIDRTQEKERFTHA